MQLNVESIKTPIFSPEEDLYEFLANSLSGIELEGKVLAVTSKIVSLAENRLAKKNVITKADLVKKEADRYLGLGAHGVELTITRGLLVPSAGIDESNSAGGKYILYPKNPYESARKIWAFLREHRNVKNFGVILTDSHSTPLRRGVTGIALSHWGIRATQARVGHKDLFQKLLQYTHVNVVDALAASAVFTMGEGNEQCPLALIKTSQVEFREVSSSEEVIINPAEDLYAPFFKK